MPTIIEGHSTNYTRALELAALTLSIHDLRFTIDYFN